MRKKYVDGWTVLYREELQPDGNWLYCYAPDYAGADKDLVIRHEQERRDSLSSVRIGGEPNFQRLLNEDLARVVRCRVSVEVQEVGHE